MFLLIFCLVYLYSGLNDLNFSFVYLIVMSFGVIDKLSEIFVFIFLYGFDVFVFFEIWRNLDVISDFILIFGYGYFLRKDCGGGVVIYVKDYIVIKGRYDFELFDSLVFLWV